eukprot:3499333-Rhodomonas_salina.1
MARRTGGEGSGGTCEDAVEHAHLVLAPVALPQEGVDLALHAPDQVVELVHAQPVDPRPLPLHRLVERLHVEEDLLFIRERVHQLRDLVRQLPAWQPTITPLGSNQCTATHPCCPRRDAMPDASMRADKAVVRLTLG